MSARTIGIFVGVVALASSLAACGSSAKSSSPQVTPHHSIVWPAPGDPMARARAAGLVPETAERLQYHVHSHLDVYVDGTPVVVPAGLGVDITNPGVHTFTTDGVNSYGGISPPCNEPCISPLHTHDTTGILHTESSTRKDNTLGQLFVEWGVKLDKSCVESYCKPAEPIAVYVDGKQFDGDPTTIPLGNLKEIAIVIGTRPAVIPKTFDHNLI